MRQTIAETMMLFVEMGPIIGTILIGFIVGVSGFIVGILAKSFHPGKVSMGFIVTTLLGIGGSFAATYLGPILGLYAPGQPAGFIGATIGAIVTLVIYGLVKGKSGGGQP